MKFLSKYFLTVMHVDRLTYCFAKKKREKKKKTFGLASSSHIRVNYCFPAIDGLVSVHFFPNPFFPPQIRVRM